MRVLVGLVACLACVAAQTTDVGAPSSLTPNLSKVSDLQNNVQLSSKSSLTLPPSALAALNDVLPHAARVKPQKQPFQFPKSLDEAKAKLATWEKNLPYSMAEHTLGKSIADFVQGVETGKTGSPIVQLENAEIQELESIKNHVQDLEETLYQATNTLVSPILTPVKKVLRSIQARAQ